MRSAISVESQVSISEKVILLPSRSVPILSSMEISFWSFFDERITISTSFSIQREIYVDRREFFSGLNVFIPLIRPIVPIDIRSSRFFSSAYFFAMCATSLRLCSISTFFALSSPFAYKSRYFFSSLLFNGFGNVALPETYPASIKTVCIHSKNKPPRNISHNLLYT